MSVYRHKNSPLWQFDFQIKGYRFSGSTDVPRSKGKRDAEAYEAVEKTKARGLVSAILATGSAPLTLKRACDRWWDEHGLHLRDPDLKARLDWIAAQIGPDVLLHAITDDMVSQMVAARRRHLKPAGSDGNGKPLWLPISARTVNKTTTSLLSRVMHRARDNWNVTILKEPNWKKHQIEQVKRPIREITYAEEDRLDAEEAIDFAAVRRFAIIMGLRRRNLLLTWSQVDFEQALIRVVTKGGIPRVIPLSREAYGILWARRGQHPEFVFTFVAQRTRTCPKTGTQFIRGQRYPMTYYGYGSHKRRAWRRADVDARIHDMRHTTGSRTLRKTGNLKIVQQLLGHSEIGITAQFYANVLVEDVRAALEATSERPAPAPRPVGKLGENE
jgi:integrase